MSKKIIQQAAILLEKHPHAVWGLINNDGSLTNTIYTSRRLARDTIAHCVYRCKVVKMLVIVI